LMTTILMGYFLAMKKVNRVLIAVFLIAYFVIELTLLIGRGAFISLVLVFALLPALLLVFNSFIKYTTIGWPGSTKSTEKKLEL